MKTGSRPGKAVARYQVAVIRGSVLSPPQHPVRPVYLFTIPTRPTSLACFLLSSISGIMSNHVGDSWYLCPSPDFGGGWPRVSP